MRNTRAIFLFFGLLICFASHAAIITSTAGGGNWTTGTSWVGGVAPAATDDVIIVSGATINLTTNQTCKSLTINGSGILNMNTASRTLTITGNLTINGTSSIQGAGTTRTVSVGGNFSVPVSQTPTIQDIVFSVTGTTTIDGTLTLNTGATAAKTFTGTFTISSTGTFTNTSQNVPITLGGSMVNNGIFNQGTGLVTFTGAASNTVTGTAATTAFGGGITINKGTSQANVLDVQCVITMLSGGLILTNGTFKLSSASTITAFTTDPNFGANAQLWCNGGTILASNTTVTYSGAIQVTAGTLNIGTSANHYLYPKGGSLTISGGALNVAGPLSDSPAGGAAGINFNMSGGTCTVTTASGSTADYPFLIQTVGAINSQFTMTGGTLIIQNSSTVAGFSANAGYYNHTTLGGGFTGGTLQIGNASSASSAIEIDTSIPIFNLTMSGSTTTVASPLTINGNVTLNSAASFRAGAYTHSLKGNWTNNGGTFVNTGSTLNFNGTTTQTIGGSSATSFNNFTLSGSNTVSFSLATTIAGTLTQNSGTVINPNSITTHTARTYMQNGTAQAPGTFGSTTSSATNQNNTFFTSATTGIITVSNKIYFTRQTGNWALNTTWSTVTYGNATNAGTFPVAGDDANIGGGFTITVAAGAACGALVFRSVNETNQVSISSGITLAVSTNVTLPRTPSSGSNTVAVGAGTLTANALAFTNSSTNTGIHRLTISTGTVTISGDVISDAPSVGTNNSPAITFSGAGTLNLAGAFLKSNTCTFTASTGTVNYNSTSIAQTIGDFTYNNLILNNTSSATPQFSLLANTTTSSILTMTSGQVDLRGFTFTLSSGTAGALSHSLLSTAGWMYNGTFTRAFPATAITVGTSQDGLMPMGTSANFRPFFFGKTNTGGSAGTISMTHTDPVTTTTGLLIADIGPVATIIIRNNSVWASTLTGGTGATFGIRYGGTGLGTVSSLNDVRSMLLNSVIGTNVTATTVSTSDPRVERSGLTAAQMSNSFYVGSTNSATSLPIELISFSGIAKKYGVELEWATVSEQNNDYFTVSHSATGANFQPIGTVKGNGTTNAAHSYTLTDFKPVLGNNYYQLQQTDFDGKTTSTEIITVNVISLDPLATVYPNPVSQNQLLNIEINTLPPNALTELRIVNMQGVTVSSDTSQSDSGGTMKATFSPTNLSPGIYILTVQGRHFKFVVE